MNSAVFVKVRFGFDCPPAGDQGNKGEDGPYIYIEKNYTVINDVVDEKHKLHQY